MVNHGFVIPLTSHFPDLLLGCISHVHLACSEAGLCYGGFQAGLCFGGCQAGRISAPVSTALLQRGLDTENAAE